MRTRTIFHVDMDAFFASIEIVKNPALRGKAVIVGGNPDRRGVVSTCSYEARSFGVRSAMALSEAKRRCPHGIFLEGDHSLYREYSERVMELFRSLTLKVEPVSIDEAYLDVTDIVDQYENAVGLAKHLYQLIHEETLLTCSVGIATNKLVAKIASGQAKPNGFYEVAAGKEAAFLAPLSISAIPGIGVKTQEMFFHENIRKIEDLQAVPLDVLVQRFETRGYQYHLAAYGRDSRLVDATEAPPKSIGAEQTFAVDQCDREFLLKALRGLTEKACHSLIKRKMRARAVTLKLRDTTFKTMTRSHQLFAHTQDLDSIFKELFLLFDKTHLTNQPLRLIGVSLHKLTDGYWQPALWDWEKSAHL